MESPAWSEALTIAKGGFWASARGSRFHRRITWSNLHFFSAGAISPILKVRLQLRYNNLKRKQLDLANSSGQIPNGFIGQKFRAFFER